MLLLVVMPLANLAVASAAVAHDDAVTTKDLLVGKLLDARAGQWPRLK